MPFYVLPFLPVAPTLPFWLRAALAFGPRMEQHRPRRPSHLCVQPAPRGWLLEGLLAVGLLLASAEPSPPPRSFLSPLPTQTSLFPRRPHWYLSVSAGLCSQRGPHKDGAAACQDTVTGQAQCRGASALVGGMNE